MLADAFESLKKFDWGADITVLTPIDDAAVAAKGDGEVARDLEVRLIAALEGPLSRDAHDYVCRKLTLVGTAAAVTALAPLLANRATSHMARYALERITAPEAAQALREALPTLSGELKIGVISSLGARGDRPAVPLLGGLLHDHDAAVARAAALALGDIGTAESAALLQAAHRSNTREKSAVIDGLLSCAEALLRHGQSSKSLSIYQSLAADDQPRLVRLAAARGVLACGDKHASRT